MSEQQFRVIRLSYDSGPYLASVAESNRKKAQRELSSYKTASSWENFVAVSEEQWQHFCEVRVEYESLLGAFESLKDIRAGMNE